MISTSRISFGFFLLIVISVNLYAATPTEEVYDTVCYKDDYILERNGVVIYTRAAVSSDFSTSVTKDVGDGRGDIKYVIKGKVQKATYNYTDDTLNLTIGEVYTWGGKEYSTPGIYTDTVEWFDSGCPKVINTLCLSGDTTVSLCDGATFTWDRNGETYKETKNVKLQIAKEKIDWSSSKYAYIFLHTIKGNRTTSTTTAQIVEGESYTWFGKEYTQRGTYEDVILNAAGCDSVGTLILGVCTESPQTDTIKVTINHGESFYWKYRDTSYTTSTQDEVLTTDYFGCPIIMRLELIVQPVQEGHEAETICDGETYVWHGQVLTQAGTYTDPATGATLHLGVLPIPDIGVCDDKVINYGETTKLQVWGADYYKWWPTDSLSSEWANEPDAWPIVSTTYNVKSYNSAAKNTVVNGDFEQGNQDFTTECVNSTTSGVYGKYIVSDDSYKMWTGSGHHYDHTSGDGQYMVIDGFSVPNKVIWQQEVVVSPHTDYIFSAWFMSLHTSIKYSSYARLQFFVNDIQLGDIVESPHTGNIWGRYYELWDSGENTTAVLSIKNQNLNESGNDFGLDDISFQALGPCFGLDSIRVTINFDIHLYPSCGHDIQTRTPHQIPGMTDRTVTFSIPEYCSDQYGTYVEGDQLTVYVHSEECREFSKWSDGSTDNPRIFTVGQSDFTVAPIYVGEPFTIYTYQKGEGEITGSGQYMCGETATITAIPEEPCWVFSRWEEDGVTDPVRTFEVTEERTFTAIFEKIPYTITIKTKDGTTTQGSVTGEVNNE